MLNNIILINIVIMNFKPVLMSNKQYDEVSALVRESYKHSCILFIDEIENPILENYYEEYKSEIIKKRGSVEEKLLFHGTHAGLIDIISMEGFDPSKNVASAHGKGSYFAKNAAYSKDYMKSTDKDEISYMFLAKVAVGKCTTRYTSSTDFDNYVDNVLTPSIFVAPHRYGAIPKYIIAFYKNATYTA